MKYTTLDNVIRLVCAGIGDMDYTKYVQVSNFARMACAQLSLYLPHSLKTVMLVVDDKYQAALPGEASIVEKVGVLDDQGKLIILWKDDRIRKYYDEKSSIIPEDCDCEAEAQSVDNFSVTPDRFSNFYFSPNQYGEAYGYMPTRFPWGSWRHNIPLNRLEFSNGELLKEGDTVLVEYRMAENAELYHALPSEAEMLLYHKTLSLLNAGQKPGVANFNDIQFRRQWESLKRLYRRMSPEELAASLRQHTKGGPKW